MRVVLKRYRAAGRIMQGRERRIRVLARVPVLSSAQAIGGTGPPHCMKCALGVPRPLLTVVPGDGGGPDHPVDDSRSRDRRGRAAGVSLCLWSFALGHLSVWTAYAGWFGISVWILGGALRLPLIIVVFPDGDGGTGLVGRIGEAVLGGAVECVDQSRRGVGRRRLPGHEVLDPHHDHRVRAHVRRADNVLVAGDTDLLVGAGTKDGHAAVQVQLRHGRFGGDTRRA
jgi:hypothetical protein